MALLLPLLFLLCLAEPPRPPATALFVLGDSTVSCAATTLPLNLTSPSLSGSGPCLFPSTRRLLPDLLAAKMGLPPPLLISTLNGTAASVAGGVNFGGQYGAGGVFRAGAAVGQQLRLAAETLQLLQLEAATSRDGAEETARAVFVVSFGADAAGSAASSPAALSEPSQYVRPLNSTKPRSSPIPADTVTTTSHC